MTNDRLESIEQRIKRIDELIAEAEQRHSADVAEIEQRTLLKHGINPDRPELLLSESELKIAQRLRISPAAILEEKAKRGKA